MRRINTFLKQMHLLNIILVVILILLVAKIAHLSFFSQPHYPELPKETLVSKSQDGIQKQAVDRQISLQTDYDVITENNLFHPSRTVSDTDAQTVETDSKTIPEFILYGTLITSEFSLAYLEDLRAPMVSSGGRKKQVMLKKGETLSGYTLKDIAEDQVIMADDDDEITVYLTAEKSRQQVSASVQKPKAKTPSPSTATRQAPATVTKKPQSGDTPFKKAVEQQTIDAQKEKASAAGQKLLDFFRRGR
jgi:hypothetical protein